MSDRLDDLEALWRSDDRADKQQAAELGETAVRRVRRVQAIEAVSAVIIALALVATFLIRPTRAVLSSGGLVLLALTWSTWARHRLSEQALQLRQRGGHAYAAALAEAKKAELRRSRLGLLAVLPAAVLTAAMVDAFLRGRDFIQSVLALPSMMQGPLGITSGVLLVLVVLHTFVSHRRLKSELRRLEAVQHAYRDEEARDFAAGHVLPARNS